MRNKNCFKKLVSFNFVNPKIDYVMFVDENGSNSQMVSALKSLSEGKEVLKENRYFTLTGCFFEFNQYIDAIGKFSKIKNQYWKDGSYIDSNGVKKYICFHSREIRRREMPFDSKSIDTDAFMNDLTALLEEIDCKIISITIDVANYIRRGYTKDLYQVAFDSLLQRYIFATKNRRRGIIIFEKRGRKEDEYLLEQINDTIFRKGVTKITPIELQRKISGVFFNSKWKKGDLSKTYVGLEIADLFSYPIHSYVKNGVKNRAFYSLENKLDGYPNYMNKGIRIFPSQDNKKQK